MVEVDGILQDSLFPSLSHFRSRHGTSSAISGSTTGKQLRRQNLSKSKRNRHEKWAVGFANFLDFSLLRKRKIPGIPGSIISNYVLAPTSNVFLLKHLEKGQK